MWCDKLVKKCKNKSYSEVPQSSDTYVINKIFLTNLEFKVFEENNIDILISIYLYKV